MPHLCYAAPPSTDNFTFNFSILNQALAELQLDGQSNFGFQTDDDCNCDSVSRYTATTEVADDKDNADNVDKTDPKGKAPKKKKTKADNSAKADEKTQKTEESSKGCVLLKKFLFV